MLSLLWLPARGIAGPLEELALRLLAAPQEGSPFARPLVRYDCSQGGPTALTERACGLLLVKQFGGSDRVASSILVQGLLIVWLRLQLWHWLNRGRVSVLLHFSWFGSLILRRPLLLWLLCLVRIAWSGGLNSCGCSLRRPSSPRQLQRLHVQLRPQTVAAHAQHALRLQTQRRRLGQLEVEEDSRDSHSVSL